MVDLGLIPLGHVLDLLDRFVLHLRFRLGLLLSSWQRIASLDPHFRLLLLDNRGLLGFDLFGRQGNLDRRGILVRLDQVPMNQLD